MFRFVRHTHHIGLVIALSLVPTLASAQNAWEVVDHEAINAIKDGFKKESDLEQKQLDQLTFQLAAINLTAKLPDQNLKKLEDSSRSTLVEKTCGSNASNILSNGMTGLDTLVSQPVDQSQQQICASILTTEIDKYNTTVDMLDRFKDYQSALDDLIGTLGNIQRVADANLISSQAQVYISALNTEMANWRAQMDAYDTIIRTLQEQRAMLARVALNGTGNSESSIGGSLLQTALTAVLLKLED